jgi:hypothetical protein
MLKLLPVAVSITLATVWHTAPAGLIYPRGKTRRAANPGAASSSSRPAP